MTVSPDEADKANIIIWSRRHGYSDEILFIKQLRECLSDKQIVAVLKVIDETCPHCWDGPSGCQCWNNDLKDTTNEQTNRKSQEESQWYSPRIL